MQTYTFLRDGIPEVVERESFGWEAYFKDGSILKQFGDDGVFHQIKEINQSEMTVFKMVEGGIGGAVYTILWNPARSLICFYKNYILDNGQTRLRLPCFGYTTHVNGVNHNVIMVISHTGELIVTEDVNNIEIS